MSISDSQNSSFAWINSEPPSDQSERLAEIYEELGVPKSGQGLDHILRVHAAMPETMQEHLAFYQGILRRPGPLSRMECEIIGVVVSTLNECHY